MYRPYGNNVPNSNSFLDVESSIRGLSQDFCTAFNTGNYDQVTALFAADGIFMPPRHEAAQGRKAIEQLLREYGESGYQDSAPGDDSCRPLRRHGDRGGTLRSGDNASKRHDHRRSWQVPACLAAPGCLAVDC